MLDLSYDFKPGDRISAKTIKGWITGTVRRRETGLLAVQLDPEFEPLLHLPLKLSNVRRV